MPTLDVRFLFFLILIVSFAPLSGCKDDPERTKSLQCIPEDLQESVIALYSFPKGSLNDFTGNKKKLTKVGAVQMTADRFGNPNAAYALDNIPAENNMYLKLDDPSYLNGVKEFTVSLWYAPSDPARDGGITRDSFIVEQTSAAMDVARGPSGFTIADFPFTQPPPRFGTKWCLYLVKQKLLLELVAGNISQRLTMPTQKEWSCTAMVSTKATPTPTMNAEIQWRRSCALFLGYGYTGSIDDVIIFNKVLTEDEVDALNAMGACL